MSDPVEDAAAPAVVPPATPAVAETPPTEAAPENQPTPEWISERIKQTRESERKRVLQELKVESLEALQAKLKRYDELESASLSEQEKTQKLIEELTPKAQRAERLENVFKSVVETRFSSLTEQQQAAIDAKASGDAEQRWEMMEFMASVGALSAPTPPAPRPATTAPAGATPPPAPATPQTPRDIWQAKQRAGDHIGASIYFQHHAAEINQSPS